MSNTSAELSRGEQAAKDGRVSHGKPKAYSYLRFSTADQIRGDSFRRQTELARTWCEKTGVPLVDNYRDLGVSAFRGANADKGALKAFLDRVESGVIEPGSYLIVESLDRLSRTDITFALQMFLGLINAGIVIVTLGDQRVYDRERINDGNFTDIIISLTILSRANEESRIKSSRLCAAWANKRARASVEKTTSRCPSWMQMKPDRSGFELIPEKAAIVRRIFEMTAAGTGQLHIARVFTLEKVPCLYKTATHWYCGTIKNVLLSRAVIGEYQPTKMIGGKRSPLEAVPDYYPAAVPMDLYAAVQRIYRARPSYRGRGQSNPLAGVTFSAVTGNRMARLSKDTKKRFTYLIDAAAPTGGAPYKTWQFEQFLRSLLTVCEAVTTAPAMPHKQNPELLTALKRLDELEVQIPRLVEFIASGFSASVDQKMRELETEKAALERKISELRMEENAADVDVSQIDWADTQRLKENIRAVIRRIDVHPFDRWFKVTLFDGREVIYREAGDEIEIVSSESPALVESNATIANDPQVAESIRKSRRRSS